MLKGQTQSNGVENILDSRKRDVWFLEKIERDKVLEGRMENIKSVIHNDCRLY